MHQTNIPSRTKQIAEIAGKLNTALEIAASKE